jgi:hypothetical protein
MIEVYGISTKKEAETVMKLKKGNRIVKGRPDKMAYG